MGARLAKVTVPVSEFEHTYVGSIYRMTNTSKCEAREDGYMYRLRGMINICSTQYHAEYEGRIEQGVRSLANATLAQVVYS